MSFEGNIKELALNEIAQLISLGRKSGVLIVSSKISGHSGWIRFRNGYIVDSASGSAILSNEHTPSAQIADRELVEENVLVILGLRDGHFRFEAEPETEIPNYKFQISTESLLVESVRREDDWFELQDLVPNAKCIPVFVDIEPKALPLLHLSPAEWEVLTRVDGIRTIHDMAQVLGRETIDLARTIHSLVKNGLLAIRAASSLSRSESSDDLGEDPGELWIPDRESSARYGLSELDEDSVFDPMRAGLLTPHGTPALIESIGSPNRESGVAYSGSETSSTKGHVDGGELGREALERLRLEGNVAMHAGNFDLAIELWERFVEENETSASVIVVKETIALAKRLQQLLDESELGIDHGRSGE